RAATLDCIAVVAHLLGSGNLEPLLEVIPITDSGLNNSIAIDSNTASNGGLLEAVRRRLARRQLPRLDSQYRVVRGISTGPFAPNLGNNRNGHALGSPGLSEKQSETVGLITVEDSAEVPFRRGARHMSNLAFRPGSASKGLHRRPSAGSNNRLPWNPQTSSTDSVASSSGVSSAASPRCPENTLSNIASAERSTINDQSADSHLAVRGKHWKSFVNFALSHSSCINIPRQILHRAGIVQFANLQEPTFSVCFCGIFNRSSRIKAQHYLALYSPLHLNTVFLHRET
ncbi:hypothetical protein FBUS_09199, partial [Fasciolopsis buskii]